MTENAPSSVACSIIGLAAGKEVVSSMVRASPFSSWTGGASITPNGAKEQQCSGSTFLRVLFHEVPTLAAAEGEPDGSHA